MPSDGLSHSQEYLDLEIIILVCTPCSQKPPYIPFPSELPALTLKDIFWHWIFSLPNKNYPFFKELEIDHALFSEMTVFRLRMYQIAY